MKIKALAIAVMASVALVGCGDKAAKETAHGDKKEAASSAEVSSAELTTKDKKISYIIGLDMGGQALGANFDLDHEALMAGMLDALKGNTPRLSDDEKKSIIEAFNKEQYAKQQAASAEQQKAMKEEGDENAKKGAEFLAENGKKDGVKTTKSGLQYKVIESGKGDSPKADSQVEVRYRGTLIDGTEFDNSEKHGGTLTFGVNQVIAGWTEALQMMKEGDKWQLFIPSNLAYGPRGTPGLIGPNETLVFDVELVDVK